MILHQPMSREMTYRLDSLAREIAIATRQGEVARVRDLQQTRYALLLRSQTT